MKIEARYDTRAFDAALAKFLENSKRETAAVLRDQARNIVRNVVDYTPPGSKSTTGSAAKKAGEAKVEGDIRKVMVGVDRGIVTSETPASAHARYRSNGVVRKEVIPRIRVRSSDLKALIKAKKAMVGFLASGWKSAAQKFGARIPAWVARHSAPGDATIETTWRSVEVVMRNRAGYGQRIRDMHRRIQWAINAQARAMRAQLENFALKRAGRRSGFR